jgi:uncharacterized protein YbdZ (MbtH family)
LAHEKSIVFTVGDPHERAATSSKARIAIPEGWQIGENVAGQILLTSPEGVVYLANEAVQSLDDAPALIWHDGQTPHRIALEWSFDVRQGGGITMANIKLYAYGRIPRPYDMYRPTMRNGGVTIHRVTRAGIIRYTDKTGLMQYGQWPDVVKATRAAWAEQCKANNRAQTIAHHTAAQSRIGMRKCKKQGTARNQTGGQ